MKGLITLQTLSTDIYSKSRRIMARLKQERTRGSREQHRLYLRGCLAADSHCRADGGEPNDTHQCAGPQRPALCCVLASGGQGAVPARPARRYSRLLGALGGRSPDPTRPAERAAPPHPVTGRGEAPQEVSSGSWVKVLRQERAP